MEKLIKWMGGIIGAVILERLLNLIPIEKLFTAEKWNLIIQDRISILDVMLFVVSSIIVFGTIKFFKIGKRKESRLERHLKKINKMAYENIDVKVTWDMYMGSSYDHDPHPYNIKIFCTKHNPPLLMPNGVCPNRSCPNARRHIDKDAVKNQIESILLAERDSFLNK